MADSEVDPASPSAAARPATKRSPGGRRVTSVRYWTAALLSLLTLLLGVSWALASHPGSSPDDNFHLASIWCAWGTEATGCIKGEESGRKVYVEVPALDDAVSDCLVFRPEQSAACIADDPPEDPPYPAVANAGTYPPGYYATARLFVGDDAERSLLVLRIAAFVVSATLLALAGLVLKGAERWRSWWFLLVASTPLALFLFASNNPSGTTISGCVAVTAAAYAAGCSEAHRHRALTVGVGVAGATVAGMSRGDGWQFALLSIGIGALASVRSTRRSARPSHLLPWAAMAAVTIAVFLASDKSATGDYSIPASPDSDEAPVSRFALLLELPRLYVGEFATHLGWFDTPMPAITWVLAAVALGGVVVLGAGDMTRFRAISLSVAAAALIAVPFYMQLATNNPVGEWVQPRYLQPLVLSTVIVLAARPGPTSAIQGSRIVVVSLLAVIAHAWALHRVIRRSVTGLDDGSVGLNAGAEWWWDIPLEPMGVWVAGSLSFAVVLGILAWKLWKSEAVTSPPAMAGGEANGAPGAAPHQALRS